jgi:beta-phosphoglucomutase-like phosphatase (HAD superfamily)
MASCIAIEDSISGLTSAAASGATTLAQVGFNGTDVSDGPQFASINGYEGLGVAELEHYVRLRLGELDAER